MIFLINVYLQEYQVSILLGLNIIIWLLIINKWYYTVLYSCYRAYFILLYAYLEINHGLSVFKLQGANYDWSSILSKGTVLLICQSDCLCL